MRWRPLLASAGVSLVCLAGFWELAEDFADSPAVATFDTVVSVAIQSLRGPLMTAVMTAVTALGGVFVVAIATTTLAAMLWLRGRRREGVFAAVTVGGGMLLSTLAKGRLGRARPPASNALASIPGSASFPSGHTMASLCLAAAVAVAVTHSDATPALKRATLAGCVLYPVAVGFSRVYLGVHWPSDVLASWLLGGAWISIVYGVYLATAPVSPAETAPVGAER